MSESIFLPNEVAIISSPFTYVCHSLVEKRKQVEEQASGLRTCNIKAIDEKKNAVKATRSPPKPFSVTRSAFHPSSHLPLSLGLPVIYLSARRWD